MRDRSAFADPAPVRCARGALREATAWSPDLLVAKGDLTQRGWRDEWARLGTLVEQHAPDVELVAVPGNHDTPIIREVDPHDGLALAKLRSDRFLVVDLPGVRVLVVDSSMDARSGGTVAPHRAEVLDGARDAARDGRAVLLCLHHPFEQFPWPTKYPRCIPFPVTRRFLGELGRANPRVVVTGGHTHRNRRFDVGPVVHTEVGSVKDYPGVWGGYVFHEGGVRQVVRRVMAPDAIGWIEYSRLALGGLWQFYATGPLRSRCFTHGWPA
jgi:3',5'-cyclic AMP phosphodiesterase CpdA